jgi:hypothetical protein
VLEKYECMCMNGLFPELSWNMIAWHFKRVVTGCAEVMRKHSRILLHP